jgi:hypothetical protein
MRNQVFGADREGALQFAPKCRDRFLAKLVIAGREVDEVTVVDREGIQVVLFPDGLHAADIERVGIPGSPHARTRREDLERVRPNPCRGQCGFFE